MIRLPLSHLAGTRVYTLGPMTGYEDHNRPAFRAAAATLRGAGVRVSCPDELDDIDPIPTTKWADYLARDLRWVLEAEAGVALPGWRESRGAKLETCVLAQLGRPVYELLGGAEPYLVRVDPEDLPEPVLSRRPESQSGPLGEPHA